MCVEKALLVDHMHWNFHHIPSSARPLNRTEVAVPLEPDLRLFFMLFVLRLGLLFFGKRGRLWSVITGFVLQYDDTMPSSSIKEYICSHCQAGIHVAVQTR